MLNCRIISILINTPNRYFMYSKFGIMKHSWATFLLPYLLVFVTCSKDKEVRPEIVIPSDCKTTALTATISSSLQKLGYEHTGTFGVMYVVGAENAESIFRSWKDGNDKPECEICGQRVVRKSDEILQVVIENLVPDSEYSYCVFFISMDKSYREIGAVSTFRTQEFNPEPRADVAEKIKHYTAEISGRVTLETEDLRLCDVGLIVSDSSEVTLNTGNIIEARQDKISQEGVFVLSIPNLRAGMEYRYRAFVKIKGTGNYNLGDIGTFTTASPDDMAVDLGLSVKWADRDLGTDNLDDRAPCYAWGHLISHGTYFNLNKKDYKYWDSSNNSYIDIGSDISGTEYDVVRYLLGGKWRMPTKTEVEELLTCRIEIKSDGGVWRDSILSVIMVIAFI